MIDSLTGSATKLAIIPSAETTAAASIGTVSRSNHYTATARDARGVIKWVEQIDNIVVTVGLNDVHDKYFGGSSYTAAHYVLLTDGTPTVAASDTMSSHSGWTEPVPYSDSTRPAFTAATAASGSTNNSASPAVFNINGTATIGGIGVATDSTKSGTSGVLYGAGAFTGGDQAVTSGDTLTVTITMSSTSS